jgi:glycine/D-amino acid oxidase-like deaminating enzyme
LGAAVDYPMNYHVTGSIRLAHSKERMQEFQRAKGMGKSQGMDLDILAVDEIKNRYPFIETHDLHGALYDPNDGDIDPAQLTQALAKGARDLGAKFCVSRRRQGCRAPATIGSCRPTRAISVVNLWSMRLGITPRGLASGSNPMAGVRCR